MLNVFIDVCADLRLAIIKNGNVILVQTMRINNQTMNRIMERLNGIEIDHLIFSMAGFYYKKPVQEAYTPLKLKIGEEELFCNLDIKDLQFLLKIKEKLKCADVRFVERTGYLISLAQKKTINYENYGEYTQFYIVDDKGGRFCYSYTKDFEEALSSLKQQNESYTVINTKNISSQKLLTYIRNKNLIRATDMISIKNFLSLCLFFLSNLAKDYTFECDENSLLESVITDFAETQEKDKATEDIKDTVANLDKPNNYKKTLGKNDIKFFKRHTKDEGYYLKYVFLVAVFLNMCLIGVAVFCQRDVVALTKQSSQMTMELNSLNSKTQLLKDAEAKNINTSNIEKIQKILELKLEASIGEIVIDWDNNISVLLYVDSLDKIDTYQMSFSKISDVIEYESEGTIVINNKLWYKLRFELKQEA